MAVTVLLPDLWRRQTHPEPTPCGLDLCDFRVHRGVWCPGHCGLWVLICGSDFAPTTGTGARNSTRFNVSREPRFRGPRVGWPFLTGGGHGRLAAAQVTRSARDPSPALGGLLVGPVST